MNKTSNYSLNQWDSTDRILMEDFNADNAKIDAALGTLQAELSQQSSALSKEVSDRTAAVAAESSARASAISAEKTAREQAVAAEAAARAAGLALKGNCQVYVVSYTGDGTNTQTLTFEKKPALVVITGYNCFMAMVQGSNSVTTMAGTTNAAPTLTWSGNSVTWRDTSASSASFANYTGYTYYAAALCSVE